MCTKASPGKPISSSSPSPSATAPTNASASPTGSSSSPKRRAAPGAPDSRKTFTVIYNGLNRPQIEASARAGIAPPPAHGSDWPTARCASCWWAPSARARGNTTCPRRWPQWMPRSGRGCDASSSAPGARDEYNRGLHDLVAQLPKPLHDRVRIVHDAADISPYYRAADIKVCSSRIESAPASSRRRWPTPCPSSPRRYSASPSRSGRTSTRIFYAPGDIGKLATHLGRLVGDDALRQRESAGRVPPRARRASPPTRKCSPNRAEVFREAADSPAPSGQRRKRSARQYASIPRIDRTGPTVATNRPREAMTVHTMPTIQGRGSG